MTKIKPADSSADDLADRIADILEASAPASTAVAELLADVETEDRRLTAEHERARATVLDPLARADVVNGARAYVGELTHLLERLAAARQHLDRKLAEAKAREERERLDAMRRPRRSSDTRPWRPRSPASWRRFRPQTPKSVRRTKLAGGPGSIPQKRLPEACLRTASICS